MSIEPTKDPNKTISEEMNESNQEIICKDGFCFLPNIEQTNKTNIDRGNFFDPI